MKSIRANSIISLLLAVVMSLFFVGTASAEDAISFSASEPATIYYTTNGATPSESAIPPAASTERTTSHHTTNGESRVEPRFPLPSVILSDPPGNEARKSAVKAFKEKLQDQGLRNSLLRIGIFDNLEEIDRAELGERFQVQDFNKIKINEDDTPYNPVAHMRIWNKRWIYLVRVDGRARTIFFIDVGLGSIVGDAMIGTGYDKSPILARTMERFLSAWPTANGYSSRVILNAWDIVQISPGSANKRYMLWSVIELWKHDNVIGFFPLTATAGALGEPGERIIYENFASVDLIETDQFMAKLRTNFRQPAEERFKLLRKR